MKHGNARASFTQTHTKTRRTSLVHARGTKPRLLVVDDERHVLDAIALQLRRRFDVVCRTSGFSALDALEVDGPFAVVLSDLRMPGMDGIELLTEVRRRSPSTSRVLLTGHGDLQAAVAAVNDAAVHRFLTKPCPPARLAQALEEALDDAAGPPEVGEQLTKLGRQATLGTMAGSIGHEIGNLVAALSGSVDQVRDRADRGEAPAAEDLGLLDLLRMRLGDHASQLKTLSRPRTQTIEEVDIASVVLRSKGLLDKAGVLRIAKVEVRVPPIPLYVNADAALLEGVIMNLLKNAAEALSEQARHDAEASDLLDLVFADPPTIRLSLTSDGERAIIEVEDNGPGIGKEDMARLFDAYFTTKESGVGTGLGLAIVKETVARHGGSVWAESAVGQGTSFFVALPLGRIEAEASFPAFVADARQDPDSRASVRDDERQERVVSAIAPAVRPSGR